MNRNFENRKPTKVYAKSKENQMIIKALNMFGRVPEQYELLEEIERLKIIEEKYKDSQLYIHDFKEEIERLNNIIKEVREYITDEQDKQSDFNNFYNVFIDNINISVETILQILDREVY